MDIIRMSLTILLIFIFGKINAQDFEFKLKNCRSTSLIQIKGDSLYFSNRMLKKSNYSFLIKKVKKESLENQFQDIFNKKDNEVWLNNCVLDGSNLKFVLIKNGIVKKVFVGNYFDERLNKIALIINSYLKKIRTSFIVTIPYGTTDKNTIKQKIEHQNNCGKASKEYERSMLESWCNI